MYITMENKPGTVEKIAEDLRQEPYHLFINDCLAKSIRFRSQCRRRGIKAYVIWCTLGLAKLKIPSLGEISIPYCTHFWGEFEGKRFETSRPLGTRGLFGIIPSRIKPLLTIRF